MHRTLLLLLAMAAVTVAVISGSYVMGTDCYKGSGTGWCRNVLSWQGIDVPYTTMWDGYNCTINYDSQNDDLTIWGVTLADPGTGYELDYNAACRVAYDCETIGAKLLQFDPSSGQYDLGPWGVILLPPTTNCPYTN